jgi:hypothetical protein
MSFSNGMNEKKEKSVGRNKFYMYTAAGILVLAAVFWGIYAYNHSGTQTSSQQVSQQDDLNNVPATTSTPTSTPANVAKKLSYGDAIKAYPERFQFKLCQGSPASIAVKKGTPVMLDNRDTIAHTFKADTQTFRIAGLDYVVLYPQVLGNLVVTCDSKDRVTLNVEK